MKKILIFLSFNLVLANSNENLKPGTYNGTITQSAKFYNTYYWKGQSQAFVDANGDFSIVIPQHTINSDLNFVETTITFNSFTVDDSVGSCNIVRPYSSDSNVNDLIIDSCFYGNGNIILHYAEMYKSLFSVEGIIDLNLTTSSN